MNVNLKLAIGQFIGFCATFALALFVPAGTIYWSAGWIFLVLFFGFFLSVNSWLYKHNPALMRERLHLGTSDQNKVDKVLFPSLMIFPFGLLVFSSLDAVRYHWSSVPVSLQVLGAIVLLISFRLFFVTFRENTYLSTVIRIQEECEHSVVTTGPYRFVRHPMYSGFLLFVIGTSLLLGSAYGLLLGLLFIFMLASRTLLEEMVLRNNLTGYTAYMAKVKYRLIPYIW